MPVWVCCTPNFPYPTGQEFVQTCQGGGRVKHVADRLGTSNASFERDTWNHFQLSSTPAMDKDTAKIHIFPFDTIKYLTFSNFFPENPCIFRKSRIFAAEINRGTAQ